MAVTSCFLLNEVFAKVWFEKQQEKRKVRTEWRDQLLRKSPIESPIAGFAAEFSYVCPKLSVDQIVQIEKTRADKIAQRRRNQVYALQLDELEDEHGLVWVLGFNRTFLSTFYGGVTAFRHLCLRVSFTNTKVLLSEKISSEHRFPAATSLRHCGGVSQECDRKQSKQCSLQI